MYFAPNRRRLQQRRDEELREPVERALRTRPQGKQCTTACGAATSKTGCGVLQPCSTTACHVKHHTSRAASHVVPCVASCVLYVAQCHAVRPGAMLYVAQCHAVRGPAPCHAAQCHAMRLHRPAVRCWIYRAESNESMKVARQVAICRLRLQCRVFDVEVKVGDLITCVCIGVPVISPRVCAWEYPCV